MNSKRIRILYILLTMALALAMFPKSLTAEEPVSFKIMPPAGDTFIFGKLTHLSFVIQNNSQSVVVVQQIRSSNDGSEPFRLSSTVYGSLYKEKDTDAYVYNSLSQQATQLPFHDGMLLPGETLIASFLHRPIARQEKFTIIYCTTTKPLDRKATPALSFPVYVPASNRGDMSHRRYVPFTLKRWREITKAPGSSLRPGYGHTTRAVVIPTLPGPPVALDAVVTFNYEGSPLCLEDAAATASRISGKKTDQLRLAFCGYLHGYVVFEDDGSWLLKSKEQKKKGELLSLFPPVLLKDIDLPEQILIRVGDKQEGFGPEVQKSPLKFWDRYQIYYGDGMYTRGEFLHLDKGNIVEFLRLLHQKGSKLERRDYFFTSHYYFVTEQESGQPEATQDADKPNH